MQLAKLRSSHAPRERVSWNADFLWNADETKCHAPRERVSWNAIYNQLQNGGLRHAPRERVSWNFSNNVCSFAPPVTLHVSVWVEIGTMLRNWNRASVTLHVSVWVEIGKTAIFAYMAESRSTWACELKCRLLTIVKRVCRHAPRERVSWNANDNINCLERIVTLHVSVWVEMIIGI